MPDNNQPKQEYDKSANDTAYKLGVERAETMARLARRASENTSPQISPDSTPKRNVTPNSNQPNIPAFEDRHGLPKQEQQTTPKSNLQDVKNIGQSLQEQGVKSDNPPQSEQNKSDIEKGFDKNSGASNPKQEQAVSETDKITQQAKQSLGQESQSKSNSQAWGK
ncbi:hypothetical protein [uncultured Nostoc sp.]|uniref:hypothetical protein n=1 Tax=uncultured Nostoc sp. TaxID=340711 RepID=UPI0035CA2FE4